MKSDYPDRVPDEETPEKAVENISDRVLERALRSVKYEACPRCGEPQWVNYVAGHDTSQQCTECGFTMRLVG